MKKIKSLILGLGLLLAGGHSFAQNGLEGIIVEKYYVSNAADATGSIGALPTGSVTYRIFADMIPGYKFQAMYGVAGHPLTVSTTTSFFNNQDRGATTPNGIGSQYLASNSVALDSWFSAGACANGQLGVLKSEDNGAANLIAANTILHNADTTAGIPLYTQDGMIAGTPQSVTFVGITSGQLAAFDATSNVGNSFTTSNGSIASLNGSQGPFPSTTNKVLIGQFTTNGIFHFELNIQVGTGVNGQYQNYVASNPVGNEISLPSLTFTSTPPAPTVNPTVAYCMLDVATPLGATAQAGNTLKWYTVATGGIALATAPTPLTTTAHTSLYYVSQVNSIGNESARSLITVVVNVKPVVPVLITGATAVCNYVGTSTSVPYSIAAVANAASYVWTVPAGASIVSGQGTTAINVSYLNTATGTGAVGNITVSAVGATGCASAAKTLAITTTIPVAATAITGALAVCSYVGTTTPVTYTTAAVAGVNSYLWTVPTGCNIVSGQGTTTLVVNYANVTTTGALGNISVTRVSGCGSSAAKTIAITAALPATPGVITGTAAVCAYVGTSTPVTYSFTAVAGATYVWTVPAGVNLVSGQGTNSITVNYLNTPTGAGALGNISVVSTSPCGSSIARTYAISKALPTTPGVITGPAAVCSYVGSSTPVTYSIVAVPTALTYTWTVPTGVTLVSGQGTNSITVNFSTLASGAGTVGNISVVGNSGCGSSVARVLALTKTAVTAPLSITGTLNNVCPSPTTYTYSVAAVANATSYNWVVPAGATIASGQGTTSIVMSFPAGYTTGAITCAAANACSTSAVKSITVTGPAPTPGAITGSTVVCSSIQGLTPLTYSIAAVAGVTSYIWTAPANATIVSGQGTTSVDVQFAPNFILGNLSVVSVGNCSNSAAKTLALNKAPAMPGLITGSTSICADITAANPVPYSVVAVAGATSYVWTIPAGASIVTGAGTNSVTILFAPSTPANSLVKVAALTACGTSLARSTTAITSCLLVDVATGSSNDGGNTFSNLYPNPATDFLNFDVTSEVDKDVVVEVYNVLGAQVINQKYHVSAGVTTLKTDVSNLKNGVFMVRLTDLSNDNVVTQTMIK